MKSVVRWGLRGLEVVVALPLMAFWGLLMLMVISIHALYALAEDERYEMRKLGREL